MQLPASLIIDQSGAVMKSLTIKTEGETTMNCPICNVALVMAERHGVEIDYCPKCRGIWLDRGELDKIIERIEQGVANAPAPPVEQAYSYEKDYKHHHDDHHYDKHHSYEHHRKKSFLRELFD